MRRMWLGVRILGICCLGAAGCYSTSGPRIKKPVLQEEYRLPPQDDARFSKAPEYPKDVMNQDIDRKDSTAAKMPQNMGAPKMGMGGSPGM